MYCSSAVPRELVPVSGDNKLAFFFLEIKLVSDIFPYRRAHANLQLNSLLYLFSLMTSIVKKSTVSGKYYFESQCLFIYTVSITFSALSWKNLVLNVGLWTNIARNCKCKLCELILNFCVVKNTFRDMTLMIRNKACYRVPSFCEK